ncbi:MAG: hypothetical protein HQK49_18970 [Oligoflexia bacterium]|nr:hypothetical protein [Oligoflexia bacterium]
MFVLFKNKDKNKQDDRGVALLMVLGTITILTAMMADFIFDTKVHKLKVYNTQERAQAKLNAEAGLMLGLARMKLYREALNLLEKNPTYKKSVGQSVLDMIWSQPFMYPIPLPAGANIIQRNALDEFKKSMLLPGKLTVGIQNISSLININLLRMLAATNDQSGDNKKNNPADAKNPSTAAAGAGAGAGGTSGEDSYLKKEKLDIDETNAIQTRLSELLAKKLEEKKEKEQDFDSKYPRQSAAFLIKIIKYYINKENAYEDPDKGEIERLFSDKEMKAKAAPMSSLSELYLLPILDDNTIDLIKDQLTVFGSQIIDFNKITKDGIKFLFPDITEVQLSEFFKYRDDPDDPHSMDSLEDFAKYIIDDAKIVEKNAFNERIAELEKAGIRFSNTGSLFKITAVGMYERATYTINATVLIPVKEEIIKKNQCLDQPDPSGNCGPNCTFNAAENKCVANPSSATNPNDPNNPNNPNDPNNPNNPNNPNDPNATADGTTSSKDKDKKPEKKITYLIPRIVEININ